MMRFERVPRPRGWQTHVLAAGRKWLNQGDHRGAERPKDLWSPWREHLEKGFRELCGYTAMWTPNGQVDHFIPWAAVRGTPQAELAYEWSNLRYSVGWFNQSRGTTPVPDPFEIEDDWFKLLLPSLELVATDRVPEAQRARVEAALRWLGRDPRVIKVRRAYFMDYREGHVTLALLDKRAPLLARALRAQPTFLRAEDRA